MKRCMMAVALLAGAMLPLPAQDKEKAELPDDLALVPASAKAFLSVRLADLWESSLGKELRKGLGKEAEAIAKEFEKNTGVGPAGIERATLVFGDVQGQGFGLVKLQEKADAKLLEKVLPDGKDEKVGGESVRVFRGLAAFLKGGTVLVTGRTDDIKALLEGKEGMRGKALTHALGRAAGKHSLAGFVEPTALPFARDLPPAMALAKPLLAARGGTVWADLGSELKVGFFLAFANAKDAAKAEKTVDAARKVAIAALATYGDELHKTSKPLAELAEAAERSLSRSALTRDGAALSGTLETKVEVATTIKLVLEAVLKVRGSASRVRAQNNLKQVGLALHNYHDSTGAFPAQAIHGKDGKALLSWRVAILPYIEQQALYKEFKLDEPWDSEHNKKLLAKMPPIYAPVLGKAAQPGGTFTQCFFGKGAGWEGKKGIRLAEITDGTSQTIAVAEAAKDVPWTKPDDIAFDADKDLPALGGEFAEGFNAVFFDGSVRVISRSVKAATLKALITRAGGEPVGDF